MVDKKVLIVEDNTLNRKVFENIISQRYFVSSAENGIQAIEKIKTENFDLVLLDIQMPIMDGITACRIIKAERLTSAPIIALSAYSDDSDKALFISSGFDDFIPKPIKPQILLRLLSSFLEKHEDQVSLESPDTLSLTTFEKLRKYNSLENIRVVYRDFLEESRMLLSEIDYLIETGDYQEVGKKLHIIKGNSGTLGAMALFKFCESFELNIKSKNYDNIEKECITLKKLVNSFEKHLISQQILTNDNE